MPPEGPRRARRTLWDEGRHPASLVVPAVVGVVAAAALLDLAVGSGPGWFFDVVFVLGAVAAALLVRPRDFFAVGVLPPLLMGGVVLVLVLTHRSAVAGAQDAAVQAVVSGLSAHSLALGVGYGLCLGALAVRQRWLAAQAGTLPGPGGLSRTGRGRPLPPAAPPGSPWTSPRRSSARRGSLPPR